MRPTSKYAVFAVASLLLAPQLAAAADLEGEIADMKQRMGVMEDQLRAQSDELAEAQATVEKQNQVIEQAGLEEREDVSALSSFIEATEFSAWVATSYNFNFEGSTDQAFGTTTGNIANNVGTFTHPYSNTFQLDQAWISVTKEPTEESRAGGHIDLQAGVSTTTANVNNVPGTGVPTGFDSVGIYSAYVSYLAPIAKGLRIDAGILPTAIGWEVEQTNANITVTRGFIWTNQPVTSTGATATLMLTDQLSVMAGILNDPYSRNGVDIDRAKALTSKVAFSGEKFGASAALNYGRAALGHTTVASRNNHLGIFDAILWIEPNDKLKAAVDYNYFFENNTAIAGALSADLTGHAISVQGRLGILDSLGIGGRYEYATFTDGLLAFGAQEGTVHTVTGTIDFTIVDGLTLRPEVRYDHSSPFGLYPRRTGAPAKQDQVIALAQLMYEF